MVIRSNAVGSGGAEQNGPRFMKRVIVGFATTVLVSGGLGLTGLGVGIAHADDDCAPATRVDGRCYGPNHWCPGDSLFHLTQNHVYAPVTWDMNVCHTYYHVAPDQANQGQGIYEGPNPPPPVGPPPPMPPAIVGPNECLPWCS
ncbi:MAG: hypothetical protein QOE71_2759 [Pseudonocardiales bacterium]|jgi:hypothetical protein|nr:hypothetical protein [Pseudonocardiales bacterium]MDT5198106.1 hypothetical protein [Mycobacterium sp.]